MRPLRLILVCVLLGAVTTVGVAYITAWPGDWAQVEPRIALIDIETHTVCVTWFPALSQADVNAYQTVRPELGENAQSFLAIPPRWLTRICRHTPPIEQGVMMGSVYGFPQPALGAHSFMRGVVPARPCELRDLRPLPLGFTVDTVFYGAIWFGLIIAPGFVRRRIRKRRGLCPSCGYDRQHSSGTCPECGK